jgi:hypothetical protein
LENEALIDVSELTVPLAVDHAEKVYPELALAVTFWPLLKVNVLAEAVQVVPASTDRVVGLTLPPVPAVMVTVYFAVDLENEALIEVSELTVPLAGDHDEKVYPELAVAVTFGPLLKDITFAEAVQVVPASTVRDVGLTLPPVPAVMVTLYVTVGAVQVALMVVADVTLPLDGVHDAKSYPDFAVAVTFWPSLNVSTLAEVLHVVPLFTFTDE